MRKHIAAALVVIIAVSAFALPPTAYASGTASMDVSITLTQDDVTPPEDTTPPAEPEPSGPDFIINIPTSISLNGQTTEVNGDLAQGFGDVIFSWVNYNLEYGDAVEVYIDGAKTFTGDTFYLTTGDGGTEVQQMPCIFTRSIPGYNAVFANGPDDVLVAEFVAPSASPISFGKLRIQTYAGPFYTREPGTYTGIIHFKIEVRPCT